MFKRLLGKDCITTILNPLKTAAYFRPLLSLILRQYDDPAALC